MTNVLSLLFSFPLEIDLFHALHALVMGSWSTYTSNADHFKLPFFINTSKLLNLCSIV